MSNPTVTGQAPLAQGAGANIGQQPSTPQPNIGGRLVVYGSPLTVLGDDLTINTQIWTVGSTNSQ